LWTTWGRDWRARATPETVASDVCRHLRGGATVLLHDSDCTSAPRSWHATVGALTSIAARARSEHLEIGCLRDHGLVGPPHRHVDGVDAVSARPESEGFASTGSA
jgi:hypothetical protein